MEVQVSIHGLDYTISCGSGEQSWKWLSDQAVFRYASEMNMYPESLEVEALVLMESLNNRQLLPWFKIKDFYIPGISVLVLLEDFKRTTERLTNWQILVRGGPKFMVDVDIAVQASDLPPDAEVVEMFGNFNCWAKPVFLELHEKEDEKKWKTRIKFPPGGLLTFRFNCMHMEWTSFDYNQDQDEKTGRPTNWLIVGEKIVIKKKKKTKAKRKISLRTTARMVKNVAKNQANKCIWKFTISNLIREISKYSLSTSLSMFDFGPKIEKYCTSLKSLDIQDWPHFLANYSEGQKVEI